MNLDKGVPGHNECDESGTSGLCDREYNYRRKLDRQGTDPDRWKNKCKLYGEDKSGKAAFPKPEYCGRGVVREEQAAS